MGGVEIHFLEEIGHLTRVRQVTHKAANALELAIPQGVRRTPVMAKCLERHVRLRGTELASAVATHFACDLTTAIRSPSPLTELRRGSRIARSCHAIRLDGVAMIVHHDSVDYFRELPDMLDELLQLLSSEPTSSQIGQILRESRCQLVRLKVQVERLVISFTLDPLQGFAENASMFVVTRIAANQQNFKA